MTVSSLLAHPRQQLRRDRNYSLASTPSACEGDKHCVYFFTLDDDSKLPAPSVWLASAFGCTSDCGGDWGWESPFVISGSNQVALPFTGPFEGCTRTCYVTPNDYGDDEDYFLLWTTVKYNIPVPNYSVDVTCQGHIGMSYDIWGNHISSLETNYSGLQPPTFGPQCMLCSAQVTNTNTGKTTTMPTSQYSSFWMCQHNYFDLMLYFNYPSYCNDSDYCDEYEDECEDGSECDAESEEVAEEIAEDLAEEIEEVVQVLEGLCELLCWFL